MARELFALLLLSSATLVEAQPSSLPTQTTQESTPRNVSPYLTAASYTVLNIGLFYGVHALHAFKEVKAGIEEPEHVGSSRVDLQACKLEYSIVSPK